jgi:hypothetical protein
LYIILILMGNDDCQERAQLSKTLKRSVDAVYALRRSRKQTELLKARGALSAASKAFDKHVSEHGCKS